MLRAALWALPALVATSVLKQTLIAYPDAKPLQVPALTGSDGKRFEPARLKGRWSVVFFGFTSCPDVCPATLDALREVKWGRTQLLFVTVDPARDTPAKLKTYLAFHGGQALGLTGSAAAIKRFATAFGAGYTPDGTGFSHSTSLFVVDPRGALAGILLRPTDPAQVARDLAQLQRDHDR